MQDNILYLKTFEFANSFKYKEAVGSYLFRYSNSYAFWYSGILIAYSGEPVWFRKGIHPVYEKELIYQVENGVVVDREVVENEMPF